METIKIIIELERELGLARSLEIRDTIEDALDEMKIGLISIRLIDEKLASSIYCKGKGG